MWLMLQSIEHAPILVMKQLHDVLIPILQLNQIIVLLLQLVHGCRVLIEIPRQDDQIILLVALRTVQRVLPHELLHLFDLFIPSHERLHVQGYPLSIVTCLEVRMEQVKLLAACRTQVYLRVQDALHGDCIISHRGEPVASEV